MTCRTVAGLLAVFFSILLPVSEASGQCGCAECPQSIPDDNIRNYILRVDTALNNDLSDPTQGVCEVRLAFQHSFVGDLNVTLSAPSGQTITLIGPAPTTLSGQTDFSSWNVRFVPCGQNAFPDPGFPAVWSNNAVWGFFQSFSGSYYPHQGCLEDFNSGPVNGLWTLSISDKSLMDAGVLQGFDIEFCDPSGLQCLPCLANPGVLTADTLSLCTGAPDSTLVIVPQVSFPQNPADTSDYRTTLVISRNDTIIGYEHSMDLSGKPAGMYQFCGLSYAIEDSALVPKSGQGSLFSDLYDNLRGVSPSFCGKLSDSCMTVFLQQTPPPLDTVITLCAGSTIDIGDTTLQSDGLYGLHLESTNGCDSLILLNLSILDPIVTELDTSICLGQNLQVGNQFFNQSGTFPVTLPKASSQGCDSTVILSLNVIDVEPIVAAPDTLTCLSDTISLDASQSNPDSGLIYSWKVLSGLGDSIPENESVVNITDPGIYQLSILLPIGAGKSCSDSAVVTVTANTISPIARAGSDTVLTCLTPFVTLDASASEPLGMLEFLWNGPSGLFSNQSTPVTDEPGLYSVIVSRMDNGCTDTAFQQVAQDTVTPTIAVEASDISCLMPLSSLQGSVSPQPTDVLWSGPNGFLSHSTDTSTSAAGVYIFTATLDNGCSTNDSVVVIADTLSPDLSVSASKITCAVAEASLTATIHPPTGSILWTGPQFSTSAADTTTALPGWYTVTASGTNGCSATDSVYVDLDTLPPDLFALPDTLNCRDTGVWLIGLTTSEATLMWDSQGPGDSIFVTTPGTYTLNATGSNGCSETIEVNAYQDTILPQFLLNGSDTLNCLETTTTLKVGLIDSISVDLAWFLPDGQQVTGVDSIQAELPGLYTVEVTNPANGCSASSTMTVVQDSDTPVADTGLPDTLTCLVDSVVLGGPASSIGSLFEHLWVNETGDTLGFEPTLTAFAPGVYELFIRNVSNGCSDSASTIVIADTLVPDIAIAIVDTFTCLTTTISISAEGSEPAGFLSYHWFEENGIPIANQQSSIVLTEPLPVRLVITNTHTGCTDSALIHPPVDTAAPFAEIIPETDTLTCLKDTVVLTTQQPGSGADLGFLWVTPDNQTKSSVDIKGSIPGTYQLTVTNQSNGCTSTDSIFVAEDTVSPEVTLSGDGPLTCLQTEVLLVGGSSIDATNGTYQWQLNQNPIPESDSVFLADQPGLYRFIVTSLKNGCSDTSVFILNQDTMAPTLTIEQPDTLTCVRPSVLLVATSSLSVSDSDIFWAPAGSVTEPGLLTTEALAPGWLTLAVTDTKNGCTSYDSVLVLADTLAPDIHWGIPDTISCYQPEIVLQPFGGLTADLLFEWTSLGANIISGAFGPNPVISSEGLLTVSVTHPGNGCVSVDTFAITSDTVSPLVNVGPDLDRGCAQGSFMIDGVFSDGDSVLWEALEGEILSGATSLTPLVSPPGIFAVSVIFSENGCTASDTLVINQYQLPGEALVPDSVWSCPDEVVVVFGNLPGGATGLWSSPTGAVFAQPASASTEVISGLSQQSNLVVWTLSTPDCPSYDADTTVVRLYQNAVLTDDAIILPAGQNSALIPVLANDLIPPLSTVWLLEGPEFGSAAFESDGQLRFEAAAGFCGTEKSRYAVCIDQCPGLCDTATVTIDITEPVVIAPSSGIIPNVITPNGDGSNDFLIFDFLENGLCGDYPDAEIIIFNRWGDVIFSAQPYMNDWNGQGPGGEALPQGTYYFVLRADISNGVVIRGDVTILR